MSPAAVGALGGGGQTPFISGAGAGRVATGTGLMGLHAFLHGGERGWCRRTNNLLADAPPATGDIEYSCNAAGHFSPRRPPSHSLPSRRNPGRGSGRDERPTGLLHGARRSRGSQGVVGAGGWGVQANLPLGAPRHPHCVRLYVR